LANNRGKEFENQIKTQLSIIPDVSLDRVRDSTVGYLGNVNICDFICYKYPYEFYIECKAIHGNTLNFKGHIREKQWEGLLEKSKIKGVFAGILCWFIKAEKTVYIPIEFLENEKQAGKKSINQKYIDTFIQMGEDLSDTDKIIELKGKKKRIFYKYDFNEFFERFGC